MKKLLILLLLFPLAVLSQNKITIKSSLVSISSLAPIADSTVVGNPTASSATPRAVPLGYGLIFHLGKLAYDSTIKDTLFGVNGVSIIGADARSIGLGGFLSQNTTISGSNLWDLTIDSMQANVLHGFRVNFGSDAGWDMIVRDSATGRWNRIAKGLPGQSWQMLSAGGVGWAAQAGGGGGSSLTRQNITSGASGTVTGGNYLVNFNPASVLAAYALTLPASPNDLDVVEVEAGGTVTSGNPVVTAFSIVANGGQTLVQAVTPTTINAGEYLKYRYRAANTSWYREN